MSELTPRTLFLYPRIPSRFPPFLTTPSPTVEPTLYSRHLVLDRPVTATVDLASAIQFLLGYEASLKLAPGQKPPPPCPTLFSQLSHAVAAIEFEWVSNERRMRFLGLPPSVWSDWPLCCGLDLTPKELRAARSLPPTLLRERGLLSLFLALHSVTECTESRISNAFVLSPNVLSLVSFNTRSRLEARSDKAPDAFLEATYPSAHLAARVIHRLINADNVLGFTFGHNFTGIESKCIGIEWKQWNAFQDTVFDILTKAKDHPTGGRAPALPHEAAGLSLAKEMAVVLSAMCTAYCSPKARAKFGGPSHSPPFFHVTSYAAQIENVLASGTMERQFGRTLFQDIYREAAVLPDFHPVALLKASARFIDAGHGRGFVPDEARVLHVFAAQNLCWAPMEQRELLAKLKPVDGHTAMMLGLKGLWRKGNLERGWQTLFFHFAIFALLSGLVQPELILRARPQLLEGLVKGLARGRLQDGDSLRALVVLVTLFAKSPAVNFHLWKFFSRSGCLQVVRDTLPSNDCRKELIAVLGPRAAQSDVKTAPLWDLAGMLRDIKTDLKKLRTRGQDLDAWTMVVIFEYFIRDLTPGVLREPSNARLLLQYLSELVEEIATSRHEHGRYGVLMVFGLGKVCIAFSNTVARALEDVREGGREEKGWDGFLGALKGLAIEGASVRVKVSKDNHQGFEERLLQMGKELSSLRRRVLHELLPLAEDREAALWEGVREEEVVAALEEEAEVKEA